MKPAATLKDTLKPPFYHDGTFCGLVHDGNTRLLDVPGYACVEDDKHDSHLAVVRGWGFFKTNSRTFWSKPSTRNGSGTTASRYDGKLSLLIVSIISSIT